MIRKFLNSCRKIYKSLIKLKTCNSLNLPGGAFIFINSFILSSIFCFTFLFILSLISGWTFFFITSWALLFILCFILGFTLFIISCRTFFFISSFILCFILGFTFLFIFCFILCFIFSGTFLLILSFALLNKMIQKRLNNVYLIQVYLFF